MEKNYATHVSLMLDKRETLQSRTLKKSWSFNALLVLFVFFGGMAFSTPSITDPQSPWETKGLKEELTNKRTRTSKSFANAGNKITSFISPASIHYQDDMNNWKDISISILPNNGTNAQSHPYSAEENSVKTWFPSNPFTNYILMTSKEGSYKEKVKAINFLGAGNTVIASLPLTSSNVVSVVNGNKISYSGFNPYLTLEYSLGNDGRKFDLIINSSAFVNTLPAGVTAISIEEEFISENSSTRVEPGNDEVLVFVNGINVFKFNQPVAFDSNPLTDKIKKGSSSVEIENNLSLLKTEFPVSWIANSARQFPIHLDPTVSYYPQSSNYWTGYGTSLTGKTNGILRISTSSTHAWAKFDLSTLPSGATVTQADYYGYHYTTTGSPTKVCEMRGLGTVDPITASGSAISGQTFSGPIYNTGFDWGGTTYGWHNASFNSTGLSDVAAAAGGDIGLGFRYLSGSTTFMYHYGWNGVSGNICYLEVTYFTVPCTSTPGPNAVVGPTYAICPGSSANLSLSNTYSVGGINYQWQSSTVSAVGPFSSVPGATNSAMTTPTLNVQTWFNVLITCSSVPTPVTATEVAVMVQATTTNSIPYFEGFENIPFENELPNCSWTADNLGSASLTYTSSNTNGRTPRTGSSFASFYYNPTGDRYFYTNGLQLYAGITYSASLWYQTEYYGYNTWTDLSIMVGPNQSTTGLVTIASTNGPAISNVYKDLSNTFTVATSGIYYIAVKGAATSNCCAYYLSWDDLEVTAPCSLNTPSVTLTTNATTVCANDMITLNASGADTYVWSTGATANNITENPSNTTTYFVVGTSTLSMCSSTVTQLIEVKPAPNVLMYASDPETCAGDPVQLSVLGNPNMTYVWSDNSTGLSTIVYPTSNTTYTVLGTNSFGCIGIATQAITVNDLPDVQASSSQPNDMCVGETQVLTATGAASYLWISGITNEVFQGSVINISPLSTTIYTVTGTDANGCSAAATVVQGVSECTSLKENSFKDLSVFPNPTSGVITFELGTSLAKTFEVTDIAGKIVLSERSSEETVKLDLSDLASGVYYVKVKSEANMHVVKVIKQ